MRLKIKHLIRKFYYYIFNYLLPKNKRVYIYDYPYMENVIERVEVWSENNSKKMEIKFC